MIDYLKKPMSVMQIEQKPASETLEIQDYTVSQISNYIKKAVENNFGYVRVRGEISGLKIASSGHGYFNLKDENAILAATCWRPVLSKISDRLQDGIEVIATGKITTYAGQSRYQMNVEYLEHAGIGALMQTLVIRKAALQKEGLFDSARKRKLPLFPKCIGIITSITGAVIQDMMHRISERYPTHVVVWPVSVQGAAAAQEVSEAIVGMNALKEQVPDLIIVARGGGSIEDLWAFNEEIVVRAVAASKIPIISAIGHETDFTLTDFAADVRAPTPTAAAEFATPVLKDMRYTLITTYNNVALSVRKMLTHNLEVLTAYHKALASPITLVLTREQHLDNIGISADAAINNSLMRKEMGLSKYKINSRLQHQIIALKAQQLSAVSLALTKTISNHLDKRKASVTMIDALLSSLDYKKVLQRGFAIMRDDKQSIITSKKQIGNNQTFSVELKDGLVEVVTK